jgi:integrase
MYLYIGKRRDTFYTITSDNQRINLGHDLLAAKRKLLELEEGHSIAGSISELLDDYLKEVKSKVETGKRSARTLQDNTAEIVQLKKAFGGMRPKDLQPNHVWTYLHKFRGKEAPVRANREVSFLQAAFNWARGQGTVRDNPCAGVERNEEVSRTRMITDAELDSFSAFSRSNGHLEKDSERKESSDAGLRIALAARIAYLTGKAQAQVLRLHKTQITDKGILFSQRKRGAATLVEWTPIMRAAVDECLALPSNITSMYLIYNRQGQPYSSQGFKAMWQRLMKSWVAEGNERFTFHDLRAKAVTDLIEDGRKASELTGHRTESIPAKVYDRRAVRKSKAVR